MVQCCRREIAPQLGSHFVSSWVEKDARFEPPSESLLPIQRLRLGHNDMTSATPSSSPQFSAVQQFYEAVSHWDFEALEKLFAENYVHKTLPASANDPPKNKAEGIAHARAVGAMLGHAPLKVSKHAAGTTGASALLRSRRRGNSELMMCFVLITPLRSTRFFSRMRAQGASGST